MTTAASPLTFPGGPSFAGWHRQLASHQPRALAACHLPLQSIDALVRVRRDCQADIPTRLLLDELPENGRVTIAGLEQRVPVGTRLLHHYLKNLKHSKLITIEGQEVGCTEAGRQIRFTGIGQVYKDERRTFHFLDLRPASAPLFVHPRGWPLRPWPTGALGPKPLGIDPIREAIAESAEWKRQHGFPPEIAAVVDPSELGRDETWRGIAIVRLGRLSGAMVRVANEGKGEWLVFPVTSEGWSIGLEPLLRLPGETIAAPGNDAWQAAWQRWCMSRKHAEPAILSSPTELIDGQMRLELPAEPDDPVRKVREELAKSEVWLTIDVFPCRWAAKVAMGKHG